MEKRETILKLLIEADAERLRFSHILALKELFRSHPGKSRIEIRFKNSERSAALLQIDSSWGVEPDRKFKEKLDQLIQTAPIRYQLTE